jgi:hypothetical protein
MVSSKQELRDRLRRAWESVNSDDDPVAALRATKPFHDLIAAWEGVLAGEAIQTGATWQQLGNALGTTRQAAWARFRASVSRQAGQNGRSGEQGARGSGAYRMRLLEERLKLLDTKTRRERQRLQQRIRQLESLIRTGTRRRTANHRAPERKRFRMAGSARG